MGKIKKGEIEKGRACACAHIQVTSNVTFTVGKCSTVARQRRINFLATRKYTNLQTASLLKKSYEYRSFLDEKDPTNLASKSQVSFVSHNFKILREIGIITFPTISKLTQNLTNSSFLHFFQNSPESIQCQGKRESSPPIPFPEFANKEKNSVFVARISVYKCASDKGRGWSRNRSLLCPL